MRAATVAILLSIATGQGPPQGIQELVIPTRMPIIDGHLSDWPSGQWVHLGEKSVVGDRSWWSGDQDASLQFQLAYDPAHLFIAGEVEDDAASGEVPPDRLDRLEVHLTEAVAAGGESKPVELDVLILTPWSDRQPWQWTDGSGVARQSSSQLGGIRVAGQRLSPTRYAFEAAIPWHHLTTIRPGAQRLGFDILLKDHDPGDGQPSTLAFGRRDGGAPGGILTFAGLGPLLASDTDTPLWSGELIADLPYLLVPLAAMLGLVLLLRIWPAVRHRAPWLRPTSIVVGIALFAIGLLLPTLQSGWRDDAQRDGLDRAAGELQGILSKLEAGTLASYRGPSRDRALTQLLAGEAIARQRYTSYRSLAQMAPEQFGPAYRQFDDLPVRPYWVPLEDGQPESLQFDPPLRGSRIHVVVGRPYTAQFSFGPRQQGAPRLEVVIDYGAAGSRRHEIELDRPFADAAGLGRAHWEACVVPIALERDARALTATIVRGLDFRLVGISLEGQQPGRIEPVMLGTPTRGGVLTDLRGPWPVDAGIELAPGAVAKVAVPRHEEAPQRIWFFYRAIYPGVPTAIPGEKVAEIVLHFAGDRPRRTIVLEHQVSVFYELAFRNTRDVPPEDSPASIALDWVDESKERHVNLGYPVSDLPADAPIEAIEFRNLADYRMHFRSVVFVNERAAAPQDPPDSPLLREGQERRLDPRVRQALAGFDVSIYRDGRLSESTLAAAAREEATPLPRAIAAGNATTATLLRDGARRLTAFMPLRGDGWDGAVLGITSTDREWTAASRSASRWGLALWLCGAPFLLLLLTELLAAATSLRIRLIIVTSLASLAPLGLLSLVLVQVLEGGHVADVDAGVRTTVRSALGQLENQKQKVQASAQQWLAALTRLAATRLAGVKEEQFPTAVAAVSGELEQLLLGQLPPEWHGGFLRLVWQPQLGKVRAAPQAIVVGETRLAIAETPARLEPGVFMQAGDLLIGVRAAATDVGGNFELTAGRPVDGNLVGSLAPGHDVLLTDVRGYPLAASADRPGAHRLAQQAVHPRAMAARERTLGLGLEQRAAVIERASTELGDLVLGSEVLRDLQDTPRALLVVAQPDVRATLDLAVGRIPVRAFFLFIAGALVVLSVFLSFVVSERISRPIERLERSAQALSRGQLDTRVQVDDGGQIGALTRAFNQMASDLQARLQDLQALNRTMGELAGEHDESTTVEVLRRFCKAHTAAEIVGVGLADFAGQRLQYHGSGTVADLPISKVPLAAMIGPFSAVSRDGVLPEPWRELVAEQRSLLGLPIVFGGQTRGFVLLAFDRPRPWPVALDLMSTVVAQAAVAFERCQLQRMAVQDPVTAAFTPEYFRRRVVDEVSLAQQRSRPLVLLSAALGDGERRPRGLRRFAALLREQLPRNAVLCHAGNGQFLAVVPGCERAAAEQCLLRLDEAWRELVRQLPENEVEEQRPQGVVVQFPDEAASAEFLFQALQARVAALATPGGSAMESDESLQRAGVLSVSPAMRAVYSALRRVAPTDLPLLLEGETGVGKEVLTNLVHRWSRRAGGPLVKVHCASLSETLLASELFGHEKGAFTGADRRKIGRFEQADGGTLFLDEVGDIPLDVQVKLLRVLQEGEIDRVGGSEPVRVDVRVIAATNRDMAQMVQEGRFREDLYYRLQGMVVKVPPLRERKEELPSLVERFRAEIVADGHAVARSWSTDALDAMFRHHWPGNIRQLRNTVFRAMVMARGDVVQLRDVQAALAASGASPPEAAAGQELQPNSAEAAVGSLAGGETDPRGGGPGIADAAPASGPSGPLASVPDPAASDPPVLIPPPPSPMGLTKLSPRLEELRRRVVARGRYSTQDHMREGGVSHRTALRDLQTLVAAGHIERVGSRRGAYYRPSSPG
jgi:transcriptional regulator with AAA-type ATPase domain/HAMP domain-containing protein